MRKVILRRLLQNVVLVVVIVLVVFTLMRLTAGDPARMQAPVFASDEILQSYREQFGTDRPLTSQLWDFVSGLPHGDFGTSFRYQQPVFDLIWQRIPETALLALTSLTLALVVAILLGVAGARKPGSAIDRFGIAASTLGQSAPHFGWASCSC